MKNLLEILQFISYTTNSEVKKIQTFKSVKPEYVNGLNRAVRVLYYMKDWGFRNRVMRFAEAYKNHSYNIMPNGVLKENGVKVELSPLSYDESILLILDASGRFSTFGKPSKYCVDENDNIVLYPTPDKNYAMTVEYLDLCPVISIDNDFKSEFKNEGDTLNIKSRLEPLFIDCLAYLSNEILNGDPTDEDYMEHKIRKSEVFRLLEIADNSSIDKDSSKRFTTPFTKG